ncbi:PsbP-related protein [Paucidesulfovibrio longus]|uniref:PsbP-related protein n=1 Tax=Paucidesulfovibrio longus TaxID=889 RepID=UPI0003B34925|nr:DcrB-related protein [Paucidesulfovibrio longus]
MHGMIWKRLGALCAIFCLLALAACSGGLPDGYSEYKDEKAGFALAHPSDWEELHGMGTLVSFAAPGESTKGRPNFGVTSERLGQDMTPEQYIEQAKKIMTQVMPGFTFLEQASETINDRKGVRFKYSIEVDDQKLTLVGFAVIEKQMAYVVTGGCKDDQFKEFESVFDTAGRSLRVL